MGKTTLSLALAYLSAQNGKKTALVELNASSTSILLDIPPLIYTAKKIAPDLEALSIDAHSAFREYVLMQIKLKTLYKAVFENKLVRYFIDATPGLGDLMCIGKIYSLTQNYDVVIVDAPATGHGLGLLQISHVVSSAVKVGPLGHEAKNIDAFLHDPLQTQVVLVTLPEDMPVTETLELAQKLKENQFPLGPVFLNQMREKRLSKEDRASIENSPLPDEVKSLINLERVREDLCEEYADILKKEFPIYTLPFIYSQNFKSEEIKILSREIEKAL